VNETTYAIGAFLRLVATLIAIGCAIWLIVGDWRKRQRVMRLPRSRFRKRRHDGYEK
jgi:hypothetical protein